MDKVSEAIDCYGLLYEPLLTPCREKCALRHLCKSESAKRLQEMGPEKFRGAQEKVILANEGEVRKALAEKTERNLKLAPEISPLVSELKSLFTSFGLTPVMRRGYMPFKIDNRNILVITKMRATKVKNLVKMVFSQDRKHFENIDSSLSAESVGDYYALNVETVEELSNVVKKYLEAFK